MPNSNLSSFPASALPSASPGPIDMIHEYAALEHVSLSSGRTSPRPSRLAFDFERTNGDEDDEASVPTCRGPFKKL